MTYTSIFEKILLLFNMIFTSWVYIVFGIVTVIMLLLLSFKKVSRKLCFVIMLVATMLVLGYIIGINFDVIANVFDSVVDNLFLNIYFPSIYAYLFVLILIDVATIGSLLNLKCEKVYKIVNGLCLIITNFVFALVLDVISTNRIDVLAKESLFTNTKLVVLLEFGINIFIVWLISLLAIYVINIVTERIMLVRDKKQVVSDVDNVINTAVVIDTTSIKEAYLRNNDTFVGDGVGDTVQVIEPVFEEHKFIPTFSISVNEVLEDENNFMSFADTTLNNVVIENNCNDNSFDLSSFIPKKQDVRPISIVSEEKTNEELVEVKANTEFVVEDNSSCVKNDTNVDVKDTYTLNDYRIFNKMLKDIREHNQSNSVIIDKNLEYRLITKYSTETYNMFKTMLKIYN